MKPLILLLTLFALVLLIGCTAYDEASREQSVEPGAESLRTVSNPGGSSLDCVANRFGKGCEMYCIENASDPLCADYADDSR